MDAARTLRDLYAYNGWANDQVFGVCRAVDRARLEEQAAGTYGSIEDTLKHLVGVEDVYLFMLRSEPIDRAGDEEVYFRRELGWFSERAAQLSTGYGELLAAAEPEFYDEPLTVPWFDLSLTKHDGLLQVLHHSAQHRAQVLSVLGEHGVKVPDVDYILFLISSRGTPA
ncbi:MAG TPA: DinB family protein [Thermomicrobiaceae bacterium]|nr:DinB family protein [Thermomicrobiaceae bacterium]